MSDELEDDDLDLSGVRPEMAPAKIAWEDEDDLASLVLVRIDDAYAVEPREDRAYIGASGIGEKCDAALAFSLRGFPGKQPDPQLARIFRDGHRIEREVVRDLKKAGYRVWEVDEMTGRQHRFEAAGGHVVCNTDGLIALDQDDETKVSLLEIKSMNNNLWEKFRKYGVKSSHPKYWDQMQMMMGMGGIADCLFIAYNKDNSKYHTQIVKYDEMEWSYLKSRIVTVFEGEARKISDDPERFSCKFCFKSEACWRGAAPAKKACSNCAFSSPTNDGDWFCDKHKKDADAPCDDWQLWKPKDR